jgi:hypothetical protein
VEVGGAEGAETGLADDEVGVAYFQGGVDVEGWIPVGKSRFCFTALKALWWFGIAS